MSTNGEIALPTAPGGSNNGIPVAGASASVFLARHPGSVPARPRPATTELWVGLAVLVLVGLAALAIMQLAGRTREAVAPGVVKTRGEVTVIQALEGGTIERVLVQDGDTVQEGQPLLELSMPGPRVAPPEPIAPTSAEPASLPAHRGSDRRDVAMLAIDEARWQAEADGRRAIAFPEWLNAFGNDPVFLDRLVRVTTEFERARDTYDAQLKRLGDRIGELHGRLANHAANPAALKLRVELAGTESRLDEVRKTRRAEAMRLLLEVRGRMAALDPASAPASQPVRERTPARAGADRGRTVVAAPATGMVLYAALLQPGRTLKVGQTLFELHPAGVPQVIETTLDAADHALAREGRIVEIRVPVAGNAQPVIMSGRILEAVGAPLVDGDSREHRIPVRIAPTPARGAEGTGVLQPGMHVSVVVSGSEHPLLDAIRDPLVAGYARLTSGSWRTQRPDDR